MLVVVSYDVDTKTREGRRRLRSVGRTCQDFGQRVQFSVFECQVSRETWVKLRSRLLSTFDPERDSLRFYFLGEDPLSRVEHHGTKPSTDLAGLLMG